MTNPFLNPPPPPHWLSTPVMLPHVPHILETAARRIELDATRRGRINSALEQLERVLKGRERLSPLIRGFLTQGSFALNTTVRPRNDGEFDVDVILVMDVRRLPLLEIAPGPVLERVISSLGEHKWYADRLEPRTRCMRIRYEDGFHVDVVPAHADEPYGPRSAPIYIPTRRGGWEVTHPAGFKRWFDGTNRSSGGRLRQIAILMKRWRDLHLESGPNSMLLTTMLGLVQEQGARSLPKALLSNVAALDAALAPRPAVPAVVNPSLPTENLARDWRPDDYLSFRNDLAALRASLEQVETLRGVAQREAWREVFGDSVPS